MLVVDNVSYAYGDKEVISNLSFTLNEGEILGLLGPNGCGKTTTFRLISGLIAPLSGKITLNSAPINFTNINEVSYMIEERALNPKYRVREMLFFLGRLKGLKKAYLRPLIDEWLAYFDLSKYANHKISSLSKGNQQKIQFISCLLNSPRLLVLDEPLTGLDIINQLEMVNVLNMLKERGVMIIFSSHQINAVEQFCDKVCLINAGKMIISGSLQEIKENYPRRIIKFRADDTDLKMLSNLAGVMNISQENDYYQINIISPEYVDDIFKIIQKQTNLTFLSCEKASLGEIFVDKVGQSV